MARKELSEVQPVHALAKLVPAVSGIAGKVVMAVFLQALLKFVPESRPVARKDVMEVQLYHAEEKLVPAVRGIAGKVARAVQPSHALVKLTASSVSVLNVQAPNEVMDVQPFHVEWTHVALDKFRAGKEVRPVQRFHALEKLISLSASVVKEITGKEVSPAQPAHPAETCVADDISSSGKEVRGAYAHA